MLLAIDTATRIISIALHDGTVLRSEQSWHTNNRHAVELAPAVLRMLASCDLGIDALTALAVSIGPGLYTGLRIGVAFAKGLATSRKLPLVGATTLDILAAGQPYYQSGTGLIALVQAGRGRIIVNSYRWRKGQWASRSVPRLMTWETLLETIDGPAYITGEIDENGMEAISKAQGIEFPVQVVTPAHRLRRAGFLAQLAWEQIDATADKSTLDASKLAPVYIKSEAFP